MKSQVFFSEVTFSQIGSDSGKKMHNILSVGNIFYFLGSRYPKVLNFEYFRPSWLALPPQGPR